METNHLLNLILLYILQNLLICSTSSSNKKAAQKLVSENKHQSAQKLVSENKHQSAQKLVSENKHQSKNCSDASGSDDNEFNVVVPKKKQMIVGREKRKSSSMIDFLTEYKEEQKEEWRYLGKTPSREDEKIWQIFGHFGW